MVIIIVSMVVGFAVGTVFRSAIIRAAFASGKRHAYKEAAKTATEIADFELSDTEGRCGQRVERAYIAYDIASTLRDKATSVTEVNH